MTIASLLTGWPFFSPGEARAEDAKAKALFDQGLDDMLEERFDRGCLALQQSYALEPLPGVAFTVGECYFRGGKLAAAQEQLEKFKAQFATMSAKEKKGQLHRMALANKRLAELPARVPQLTIRLPARAPAGTIVVHNGTELPADGLGSPKSFEIGKHEFLVKLPSGAEISRGLLLHEGDRRTITLDLPGSKSPSVVETASEAGDDGDRTPLLTRDTMRLMAYISGGVGATGLLVGAITGGVVLSEKSTVDANCVGQRCNDEGLDAVDTAQTLATVSTVSIVMGLVFVGGGAALWFTAPTDDDALRLDADVSGDGASARVTLRF